MKQKLLSLLTICLLAFGAVPQTAGAEAADISYLENELKEVRRQLHAYELQRLNTELFIAEWESKREELAQTYTDLQKFYEQGKEINHNNLIKKTVSLGLATYETGQDAITVGKGIVTRATTELVKWSIEKTSGEVGKAIAEWGGVNYYSQIMTPFTTEVGKTLPELRSLQDFLSLDMKQSQTWLKENEKTELTQEDATILARWRVLLEKTEKAQARLTEMIRQGDLAADKFRDKQNAGTDNIVISLQQKEKELSQRLEVARQQQALDKAREEIQTVQDTVKPAVSGVPIVATPSDTERYEHFVQAYNLLSTSYPKTVLQLKDARENFESTLAEATGLLQKQLNALDRPILSFGDYMTRSPLEIEAALKGKSASELETELYGADWHKTLIAEAKVDLKKAMQLFDQAAMIVKNAAPSQKAIEYMDTLDNHYDVYGWATRLGWDVSYRSIQVNLPLSLMEQPLYEQDRIQRLLQFLEEVEKTEDTILIKAGEALKEAKQKEELAARLQKELEEQASPAYRLRLLQERVAREAPGWFSLEPKEFFLQTASAKDEAQRFSGNDLDATISGLMKTLNELEERYRTQQNQAAQTELQSKPNPAVPNPAPKTPIVPKTEPKTSLPTSKQPELIVLPANYQQQVRETLAALATAYQQRNLRGFMNLVSPDFLGDDFLLDRALRRDFRNFDNISLRFAVNSINIDAHGRAQVYAHYNRSVAAQKDGKTYSDHGVTQFTFHLQDGKIKLYDMKYPIIFGVSEASLLATGEVRSAENADILAVSSRGEVSVLPYNDAKQAAEQSGVKRGTGIRLQFSNIPLIVQGWSFADNRRTNPNVYHTVEGDFTFTTQWLNLAPGTSFRQLSAADVADVTEVPDPAIYPYTTSPDLPGLPDVLPTGVGNVYALKLNSGKYAVIKIVSYTHLSEFVFDYKYQPSGSRRF